MLAAAQAVTLIQRRLTDNGWMDGYFYTIVSINVTTTFIYWVRLCSLYLPFDETQLKFAAQQKGKK